MHLPRQHTIEVPILVGSNQAFAAKVSSLSITSANPATIRICDFHCYGYREFFSNSEFKADPPADNFRLIARHSVADEVAGRRLRRRGHVPRFRGGSVARRRRAAG